MPQTSTNAVPGYFRQFVRAQETIKGDPYYRAERLGLPSPARSSLKLSSQLCARLGEPYYTGLDYLSAKIVTADKHHRLSSGKTLTLVSARYVGQYSSYEIIAYPESSDLEAFRLASQRHSNSLGPGFFNQGSIGALSYRILRDTFCVDYVQSSINFKKSLELGDLDKKYQRAYSGWENYLVASLFARAKSLGVTQIFLPKSKIMDKLLQNSKLDQIAEVYGFEKVADSDRTLYLKKHR